MSTSDFILRKITGDTADLKGKCRSVMLLRIPLRRAECCDVQKHWRYCKQLYLLVHGSILRWTGGWTRAQTRYYITHSEAEILADKSRFSALPCPKSA